MGEPFAGRGEDFVDHREMISQRLVKIPTLTWPSASIDNSPWSSPIEAERM
jgi:hypothetical protein